MASEAPADITTDPTDSPASSLTAQRRALPDQPGVYLFRDVARAGHLCRQGQVDPQARGLALLQGAGALQPRPRRDGRGRRERRVRGGGLRGGGAAGRAGLHQAVPAALQHPSARRQVLSVHRDLAGRGLPARLLHARAPRAGRAYFGPYSSAKRVRSTLEVLAKVFMFRSCTGAEPGRRSGSPCLDYYIKRCGAPCVGYISKERLPREHRRRDRLPLRALQAHRARPGGAHARGRRRAGVRAGDAGAQPPARGPLTAGAPAGGQRVGRDTRRGGGRGRPARRPTPRCCRYATGCSATASPSTSPTRPSATPARSPKSSLQYYGGPTSIPALLVVQREVGDRPALTGALASRRDGPVELRCPERGEKRRILELAERNAVLALDQERLRSERTRQRRVEALDGLQSALGLDTLPVRIECFDISNLGGTHTVASMVVFEGGAPKKSDYRRFTIRTVEGSDDYASMAEVLTRRYAQWERQADISPHDSAYDPSFAALPNLVVIDGGKGQLAAGFGRCAASASAAWRWSRWPSASRRCSCPVPAPPLVLDHSTPELQLLAARARRGAPLRDHPPPRPARSRDERARCWTGCRASGRRASGRCWRTSALPRRCWRPPARSSRPCRRAREGGCESARTSASRRLSRLRRRAVRKSRQQSPQWP